ncbi:Syntaxin [Musa troglodytarum]|uniref:Syntaxin n=1 Tax=Musa troglodytarum TaxID=320322 RepID=A0A9E7EM73_9LILI|nr:Syntaxin [Musa troglodytarum]
MATRNRTTIYRKYRDALRNVRVPSPSSHSGPSTSYSGGGPVIELVSASLLRPDRSYTPLSTEDPGGSSTGATMVGLPPAWVDVSEEIAANMQRARTKMSELVKAHAKALMPSFGDGKEDQHVIELLTHEITDLLKRSEKRLQKLSSGDPTEDSNVRKNVQRSLATDLQNLSMEFRKKQSFYLKRLQQQQEGQDGVDLEMNRNGIRHEMEDDFHDVGFDEVQLSTLKRSEAFTREREREIVQVVESVNELAQIMKDLSVLVIDQGTIVDRIDYNVQNVASSVEEGHKQLEKAERTQRKGGMVIPVNIRIQMTSLVKLEHQPPPRNIFGRICPEDLIGDSHSTESTSSSSPLRKTAFISAADRHSPPPLSSAEMATLCFSLTGAPDHVSRLPIVKSDTTTAFPSTPAQSPCLYCLQLLSVSCPWTLALLVTDCSLSASVGVRSWAEFVLLH